MVKTNKDYCKTYREKKGEEYKIKDSARKRSEREKRKYLDPKKHNEFKKKEAARIKECRLKKRLAEQFACDGRKETEEERPSTSSSFSSKQILNRSIKKAERSLPLSPRKKVEVIGSLAKKFKLRIEWLENFLESADITYTTPGRRDTVYVGMDHGKRQYKQKRYLLWKIRDLLGIINASKVINNEQYASFPETFQRDLSFRQLYEFLKGHKELAWNDQIPQSSCLCEICENAVLLAKGINLSLKSKILATNVHDLVEANACDSSQDVCMVGKCELCLTSNLSLSDFDEEKATISFLNWQRVDKSIAKINQSLTFDQAIEKWNSTILTIKKHIYRKRKQVASYNQQKLDLKPGEALIHVDYSESYSNSQQDEVQSTYFGQQNFSIFTSYSYYRDSGEDNLTKVGGYQRIK